MGVVLNLKPAPLEFFTETEVTLDKGLYLYDKHVQEFKREMRQRSA